MTVIDKFLGKMLSYLPHLSFGIGVAGTATAYFAGSLDFMFRFLTVGIPLLVCPPLFIWLKGRDISETTVRLRKGSLFLSSLVLAFLLLYIVSLVVLLYAETRPVTYFVLIAAMATLIAFQILWADTDREAVKVLVLGQIVALSLNLLLSPEVTYPVFLVGDGWAHVYFANIVTQAGVVEETSLMVDYFYTPSFHVMSAIIAQITGVSAYSAGKILNTAAGQVGILSVFLFATRLSNNAKIGLLAALLLAVGRYFLYEGATTQPQSVNIYLFILVMYLIYRDGGVSERVLSLIVLVYVVSSHAFSSAAILFLMISLFLVERISVAGEKKGAGFSLNLIMAFFVGAAGYHLLYTAIFDRTLRGIYLTFRDAPLLQPITQLSGNVDLIRGPNALLGNTDQLFYIGLSLLAVFFLISVRKESRFVGLVRIAKMCLAMSFLYLGGAVLFSTLAVAAVERVPFFVEVFYSMMVAFSFYWLFQSFRRRTQQLAIAAVLFVLVLFSVSNSFSAPEAPMTGLRGFGNPYFLTDGDVNAAAFMEKIAEPRTAVTDWFYGLYIGGIQPTPVPIQLLLWRYRYTPPPEGDIQDNIEKEILSQYNYFVFREAANQRYGITVPHYEAVTLSENVVRRLETYDVVYYNGAVRYYRLSDRASS